MAKGGSQIAAFVAANGGALIVIGRSYAAEATGYLSKARLIGAMAGMVGNGMSAAQMAAFGEAAATFEAVATTGAILTQVGVAIGGLGLGVLIGGAGACAVDSGYYG